MLEQKQRQFWNLHRIPNKTLNLDFRFFLLFFYFSFFLDKKKGNYLEKSWNTQYESGKDIYLCNLSRLSL